MTRRLFLSTAALAQAPRRKPNIVLFLADDLGYGDIGCYGSPDVPTPHIDALAKTGVRFTDAYVSAAVCSPSRAALLTGLYQHRFGHEFNSGSVEREAQINFGLPAPAKIAPAYLKQAGYRSAAFGKWHLGVRKGYHPLDRGFDEFVGFLTGGNDYITQQTPGARMQPVPGEGEKIPAKRQAELWRDRGPFDDRGQYLTDIIRDEAIAFIGRNKANPFFAYLAFNAIHTPLHANQSYLDRVANLKDGKHKMLAAMTVALDDAVGAVVKTVKDAGLLRDTIFVFLSDNGSPIMTGAGSNAPLNGEKVSYYEGGIRVPMIIAWQGRVPAGKTYKEIAVSRDLLPTFLKAAGLTSEMKFDGVDLLQYLNGAGGRPHDALYWRAGEGRAIRSGKWKLVEHGAKSHLFDLASDVGEKNDVAAANPKIVAELRAKWKAWSDSMPQAAWPPRYREVTVNGETIRWEL
jgi:arylsulfatase A-like enzyme